MEQYQIEANEEFFKQMKKLLKEGGKWIWKDNPKAVFTLNGSKLESDEFGYQLVSQIISPDFLKANFSIKQ